ncbi:UPF0235 protein C15orf40 homolog [Aplysia californica]|uniref:UPF0235 protein C15orf40 homolog n=1 Tax=Aplysia californica TaxID=6500 RepID=A0ABM0JC47_APLCA|nr:UPF0235 protein C15orf40 homolog [Aplysia californica]
MLWHFTKKAAWMRQASDKMPKSASGKAKAKLGGKSAVATSPEDAKSTSPVNSRPDGSVEIKILAKPGSKHNSITGLSEEGVGVQIAAPPVDGEANTELVKYLTKLLAVRKSDLTLDKVIINDQ